MAFVLDSTPETEVRIYDERNGETQILYARDPSAKEQLAYEKERVLQKRGKTINRVRQTRLKYGCLILARPQTAETPKDEGYGVPVNGEWMPLTTDVEEVGVDVDQVYRQYAEAYGADWAQWIKQLPPWKLLLLDKVPAHIARVASVVFEGAEDHKQLLADDGEDDEPGNG